jgi:Na+-transporting NADH:ubiquinone oxidoreductase subunit D
LSRILSVFVGLIITNCIVLGRAESFAQFNGIADSLADALGNAAGYAAILVFVACVRELFGAGTLLDCRVLPADYPGNALMLYAPSAFFLIGLIIWAIRSRRPGQRDQIGEVPDANRVAEPYR